MLFLTELEDDNYRISVPGLSEMVKLFRKMHYLISYRNIVDIGNIYNRTGSFFINS